MARESGRNRIPATTPEIEYDVLDVSGDASLGGTCEVVAINGFVPMLNDAFEVVRAGAVIGQFDQIDVTGPVEARTTEEIRFRVP